MKQKAILVIALLALVSLMIAPVMAETLTGTLGGTITNQSIFTAPSSVAAGPPLFLVAADFELTGGFISMVYSPGTIIATDAGAPPGNTTIANLYLLSGIGGARIKSLGNATFGYQKIYNTATPPVEQTTGYLWLMPNTEWNSSGYTGTKIIELNYTRSHLYNVSPSGNQGGGTLPPGNICFTPSGSSSCLSGGYINLKQNTVSAEYSATKPSGLNIAGYVNKTGNSRIFIQNISSYTVASDNLANDNDFIFSVLPEQIYIKMLAPSGTWFNSSLLFAVAVPTVTPAPGPTVPPGYVRNNLYIWDQNDAQISGADVDVLDVENGSWTNTSADADGWITIDTLPYHTVNVYAHYPTSNIYLPNEILGLETGYYGGHNWVLVLYPYVTTPSGFVTLYINTRNYDTKAVLTGVGLQIKNLVTGATTGESTGSTDSVSTVVTNATNYQITGSKSGYLSKTIVINSGEASSKTVVIELSKATVTPTITGTILPGETTVRPTYSPGCDPAAYDAGACSGGKDADMMNQIRDAGPGLIGLAIIATVIGLIKLMSKR